ncbi:50S ribosomal protein L22 [Marinoscillum sp. MHG1-6]|uniref:50S ribosomal protein L22 n=1 Tax=Marinoscillum sp. MHG1-6 TaxID=2959627 RepID=UPI0021573890|nr:50S ribosomal protein L22 [Marinoscillum sp. MHG1-6]
MEAAEKKLKKSVKIRLQKEAAKKHKEENQGKLGPVTSSLRNIPTSPRKMRLVADMIRGLRVNVALNVLRFDAKHSSKAIEKLLLTAIADWQAKNEDVNIEDADLVVSEIFVDGGKILKRLRPAPQGRAHRIRKRSNHVTLSVADMSEMSVQADNKEN